MIRWFARGVALGAAVPVFSWAAALWKVRALCLGRRGWITSVLMHHFYAAALVLLVVAPIGLSVWFLLDVSGSKLGFDISPWYYIGAVACTAAMLGLIRFAIRPFYGKLKETIGPLRREIAVELARDHGRKQMPRAH